MSRAHISESGELPIHTGTLDVDTSKGSITIFMKPSSPHKSGEQLKISKTSDDHNMIYLFSETPCINNADIVIFGLPKYAKVPGAKVNTLVLQCDGEQWKIIHEE